jgi:hypothetical protein
MNVREVDKSVIQGLLDMPFSRRGVARTLRIKRMDDPAHFTERKLYTHGL